MLFELAPYSFGIAAKNKFYGCLIKSSGNEALGTSLYILNSRAPILCDRSLQMPDRSERSLERLKRLTAALDARNGEEAYNLAVHHVRQAAKTVMLSYQPNETRKALL